MTRPGPRLVRPIPGPLSDRTDDELMTLAQAGMRDAFSVLVERHGQRMVQLCSRFVDSAEIGEEIAQEMWLSVWSQRANYRADGKFVVWLIAMARNRCRNHLRHDRVVKRFSCGALEMPMQAIDGTSPDEIDRALLAERRRRVRDALGRLPETTREALLLRYAEDLRYDEMAEVLRARQSTLRSRVHYGLRQLRTVLEKKKR